VIALSDDVIEFSSSEDETDIRPPEKEPVSTKKGIPKINLSNVFDVENDHDKIPLLYTSSDTSSESSSDCMTTPDIALSSSSSSNCDYVHKSFEIPKLQTENKEAEVLSPLSDSDIDYEFDATDLLDKKFENDKFLEKIGLNYERDFVNEIICSKDVLTVVKDKDLNKIESKLLKKVLLEHGIGDPGWEYFNADDEGSDLYDQDGYKIDDRAYLVHDEFGGKDTEDCWTSENDKTVNHDTEKDKTTPAFSHQYFSCLNEVPESSSRQFYNIQRDEEIKKKRSEKVFAVQKKLVYNDELGRYVEEVNYQ